MISPLGPLRVFEAAGRLGNTRITASARRASTLVSMRTSAIIARPNRAQPSSGVTPVARRTHAHRRYTPWSPETETMARLTDYSVLTFDCYGTLIDWEGGIWDALQPLIMQGGGSAVTRKAGLLAFARFENQHERAAPELRYPELLARVHRSIAEGFGIATSDALDEAFGASVPLWPAFPDTADALRILKQHYKLVILSNVHRDGFAASNRKLGVEFDAIYTAEDIGSYKPANANFEYLLAHLKSDLGMDKADILHTAQSLHHDHTPAKRFGLANVWIDRQRLSEGGSWGATEKVEAVPATDFVFFSMEEMAGAVLAEAG